MAGGHTDYIARAKEQEAYYKNDHWTEEELAELAPQNRPALTLNHVFNVAQVILGEASFREASIRLLAEHDADAKLAELLSRIVHQVLEHNQYQKQERKALMDAVIMDGRGYLMVDVVHDENAQGQIVVKCVDPLSVVIDPEAQDDDPATWEEVFTFGLYDLDQIRELYGDKKAEEVETHGVLEYYVANQTPLASAVDLAQQFGQPSAVGYSHAFAGNEDDRRNRIKGYRVIQRQYRCTKDNHYVAVHPETGNIYPVPMGWSTDHNLEIGGRKLSGAEIWAYTHGGLQLRRQTVRMVRKTVISGTSVLLHDDWSPLGEHFSILPLFPSFRRGEPVGPLRPMLSPQDMVNKIASQMLHEANSTSNSGWIMQSDSLVNMDADSLQKEGSKPGIVLEVKQGAEPPQKIQTNPISPGLANMASMLMGQLKEVGGMGNAIRGLSPSSVSGAAISESVQASKIALRPFTIAMKHLRERLGDLLVYCIRNYYTEPRMLRVVAKDDPAGDREAVEVNGWDDEAERFINDLTIGTYDIRVQDVPSRDTYDQQSYDQILGLVKEGVPIPPWYVILASNLPDKEEVAAEIKRQAGMMEPSPEEQMLQRQMQENELQMAQLDLQYRESEIREKEANAQKLLAQGSEIAGKEVMELMKMREKRELEAQNLRMRYRMSQLAAERGMQQTVTQQQGKMATTAMQLAAQRDRSDAT